MLSVRATNGWLKGFLGTVEEVNRWAFGGGLDHGTDAWAACTYAVSRLPFARPPTFAGKLVSEATRAGLAGSGSVTSGRETTLNRIMGPLLLGNAKTWWVATFSPGPSTGVFPSRGLG